MALAVPVALLAGLISFFSPCVIPLLPGYLSYATGLGAAEVVNGSGRKGKMLAGSTLFVLGFAVIFVATGVVAGSLGQLLLEYRVMISRVLGAVIIVLGLMFAGVLPIGRRELRLSRLPSVGIAAAPLLGVVFALGWVPCVSPTLAVVVNLGFNEGSAARGGLLGFVYALGLGIPFVIAGLAFTRFAKTVAAVRRRQQGFMRFGGVLLVLVGLLLVTGIWDRSIGVLQQWAAQFATVI
ncbi:MAG TPA: cytochrome c biogenesis protein CcdA [Propionibacteriaceae bacterium]|nr:cytochrome c biogenesis protein CcdA [Propionibacteriaceae bacterium]